MSPTISHVYSRRAHARHPLPLRPRGVARPARRPPAAGAALPDVDPQLFAAHQAGGALPQLAAGSVRQPPGAAGVSASGARAERRGRSRSPRCRRSTRSTSSSRITPRTTRSRTRRCWRASWRRTAEPVAIGPRAIGALIDELRAGPVRAGRRSIDVLVDVNRELSRRLRYDIRMEPGVFAAGRDADARARVVPRLRLAGGRAAARGSVSRRASCRAIRSSSGPTSPRSTARRASARTPRICTPGPRSTCPGAGWIGLDATSGLLAGEGHIPLACTAMPATAAPISGSYSSAGSPSVEPHRRGVHVRDAGAAHRRDAAGHATRIARISGRRSSRSGKQVDRDLERLDVRLTMGGEPTFVSIDDRDARRVEHRRAGAGQARGGRSTAAPAAHALRAGRRASPRPGEVVPGRAAAALGVLLLFPPRRRADLARARPVREGRADARRGRRRGRRGFILALARRLGVEPDTRAARLRGRLLLPVARAPAAAQRRRAGQPAGRRDGAGAAGARVRRRAGRGRRLRAAAARARVGQRRRRGRGCQRRLGERRTGRCAASELFLCPGDSAARLPAAARQPAVGAQGGARPGSTSAIRCSRARRSRASSRRRRRGGR